jgi:cysteine synthase
MVVICTGTGGTMTGVARKLKERLPKVKVRVVVSWLQHVPPSVVVCCCVSAFN